MEEFDPVHAIRHMFDGECPLLSRLGWVPLERCDFLMWSHRYMTKGERLAYEAEHGADAPRVTLGISRQQYYQQFLSAFVPKAAYDLRVEALRELAHYAERAIYYGGRRAPDPGDAVAAIKTSKMDGLNNILMAPKDNLGRELVGPYGFMGVLSEIRDGGGSPDLMVVSGEAVKTMKSWGWEFHRVGESQDFWCPRLKGLRIVEGPLLDEGNVFILNESTVYLRVKEEPMWIEKDGDPTLGQWEAIMAVEVVNSHHHAWIEGVH